MASHGCRVSSTVCIGLYCSPMIERRQSYLGLNANTSFLLRLLDTPRLHSLFGSQMPILSSYQSISSNPLCYLPVQRPIWCHHIWPSHLRDRCYKTSLAGSQVLDNTSKITDSWSVLLWPPLLEAVELPWWKQDNLRRTSVQKSLITASPCSAPRNIQEGSMHQSGRRQGWQNVRAVQ